MLFSEPTDNSSDWDRWKMDLTDCQCQTDKCTLSICSSGTIYGFSLKISDIPYFYTVAIGTNIFLFNPELGRAIRPHNLKGLRAGLAPPPRKRLGTGPGTPPASCSLLLRRCSRGARRGLRRRPGGRSRFRRTPGTGSTPPPNGRELHRTSAPSPPGARIRRAHGNRWRCRGAPRGGSGPSLAPSTGSVPPGRRTPES